MRPPHGIRCSGRVIIQGGNESVLITLAITVAAIAACNAVHFLSLRRLAHVFRDEVPPVKHPMLVVSFVIMLIHLVEVMIYGLAMWVLAMLERGKLASTHPIDFHGPAEFFYFSIASYTTLGIGDIVPTGHLRIVVGIEALQGLILIAWSASFSYLVMEKFWSRHGGKLLDDA